MHEMWKDQRHLEPLKRMDQLEEEITMRRGNHPPSLA